MQVYLNPPAATWPALLARPAADESAAVEATVAEVFAAVAADGDAALRELTQRFGGPALADLKVSPEEFAAAAAQVPAPLQAAIRQARANIEAFHKAQQQPESVVETMPGVRCWRKAVAVPRVGLYVPGGSAALFSTLLMLGVPARLAGCGTIAVCTPAGPDGAVSPAVLFTAQLLGLDAVYKVGGAQAVAALALGTATVPAVDKIFGPGNRYVTAAKQRAVARHAVAIDMPAGPSEVLVMADATANPVFVAADLLSQAEHGPDSQVVLLTDSEALLTAVQHALAAQLATLPRRAIAAAALAHSRAILLSGPAELLAFSNAYAPEHLILAVADPAALAAGVINAGSVFLGHLTPESVGDYASGTNHTLPTAGYARQYAGVSLDSFVKKITFQRLSAGGLHALGPTVEIMAEAEGLSAHARAVSLRLAALAAAGTAGEAGAWVQAGAADEEDDAAADAAAAVSNPLGAHGAGLLAAAPTSTAPWPLSALVRPHLQVLKPYSSARDEFEGLAPVMLDANENSLGSVGGTDYTRYPDPHQRAVKTALAALKGVSPAQIFLGNGSDEAIDLLVRLVCRPGRDSIVVCPPTYGMYEVSAALHEVGVEQLPLTAGFQLPADAAVRLAASEARLLFLCSPNNPTGNVLTEDSVRRALENFRGLVVVDEAYADFADGPGWLARLADYPNLVVLQTFSKAWGLAGLRLGVAYAAAPLVACLDKIKPPYNLSQPTQAAALAALAAAPALPAFRDALRAGRTALATELAGSPLVDKVFPSEANFLLVRFVPDATAVYDYLRTQGIVVRNRSSQAGCANCLRLTVGTPAENALLLAALHDYAG